MKKVIVELFLLMVLAVVSSIIIYDKFGNTEKVIITEDENKFKTSYEQLNIDKKFINIRIDDNNGVEYIDIDKFEELLKSESAIIFIGTSESNTSRNVIDSLFKALNKSDISKLYYYDIASNFESKEINDKKIDVLIDNTSELKKLLTLLNRDKDNIYMPTVVFIKNKNIVGMHLGVLENIKDDNKELSKDQRQELTNIYLKNIDKIK